MVSRKILSSETNLIWYFIVSLLFVNIFNIYLYMLEYMLKFVIDDDVDVALHLAKRFLVEKNKK
jgi:hypothetical protein